MQIVGVQPGRAGDGVLMFQFETGAVFIASAEKVASFAEEVIDDDDAATVIAAAQRAFDSNPALFLGPITPKVPEVEPSMGMHTDLTERDRERLYAIIRKEHRLYFASPPTIAQMNNLIDGLGVRVVEKQLRKVVDSGCLS